MFISDSRGEIRNSVSFTRQGMFALLWFSTANSYCFSDDKGIKMIVSHAIPCHGYLLLCCTLHNSLWLHLILLMNKNVIADNQYLPDQQLSHFKTQSLEWCFILAIRLLMAVRVLLLKNSESLRILLLTHAVTWTKELCALSVLCSQRINKHTAQRPIGAEAMRVIQRANKGGEQGDMSIAVSLGRG